MDNKISIDELKKMSLSDFFSFLTNGTNTNYINNNESKIIYNSDELLKEYPMFTKYSLDQAIKNLNLPHFRIGHKRYFEKEKIDKWINDNNR